MKTIQILAGLVLAIAFVQGASAQNNELNWTMERAVRQLDRQGSDLESVLAEVDVDRAGLVQDSEITGHEQEPWIDADDELPVVLVVGPIGRGCGGL